MHAQTRRQREVLDFIIRYTESHGYRPSYQLIARHLGLNSRSGIARIVHDLETQGLLTRRHEDGHFHIDIGIGGAVVEIQWLDVPDISGHKEDWEKRPLSMPEFMLGGYGASSVRAFRVTDEAMNADHIYRDDIALIELRDFARDGEPVVAVLNKKQIVLRKFYRAGSDIELCPADEDSEIMSIAADQIELLGIYRGLLRPMV